MDSVLSIKTSHYFIAGVGIVAAISWNTAIKGAIDKLYPMPAENIIAAFIYSITITCFLILLIYVLPDTSPELPKNVRTYIKAVRVNDLQDQIETLKQRNNLF